MANLSESTALLKEELARIQNMDVWGQEQMEAFAVEANKERALQTERYGLFLKEMQAVAKKHGVIITTVQQGFGNVEDYTYAERHYLDDFMFYAHELGQNSGIDNNKRNFEFSVFPRGMSKSYDKYVEVLSELKRLHENKNPSMFDNINRKRAERMLDALQEKRDFKELMRTKSAIDAYLSDMKKVQDRFENHLKIKKMDADILTANSNAMKIWKEIEKFRYEHKNLQEAKLTLAITNFCQENLQELSMSQFGAQGYLNAILKEQNISLNLHEALQFASVASALHEDWRNTRLKDGVYEPRWKAVKDEDFAKKYASNSTLPSNLRRVDNKLEIDIANTPFHGLSFDWQNENFCAAKVVCEMVNSHSYREPGPIGHKIHEEWLKRNEWARGGELGKPFAELSKEEQDKDLKQYAIAKKLLNPFHEKKTDNHFGS